MKKLVVEFHLLALLVVFLRNSGLCRSDLFTVVTSDASSLQLVDNPRGGLISDRARTDIEEQKAVYEIMAASGNEWARSIPDVCRGRWHGIECMPDKDEVYHIVSLSFGPGASSSSDDDTATFPVCNSRHASLSSAVARLPHIRSLFFYRCFTRNPGPIPKFLGRLGSTLSSLVLRENGHIGPIPPELGKLKLLKLLDLHGNKLTSSIPHSVASLNNLEMLDLSHNRLSGTVESATFRKLKVLDLSHNRLQGRIPSNLGGDLLIKMDLSNNKFGGPIPNSISKLNNLILVDFSENCLSGPFPTSLGRIESLRALILSGNPMGLAPISGEAFTGFKGLETLILSRMDLNGPIPESIGRLPVLRVLHLDENQLSGPIPTIFRSLERLGELRLNGNRLTGPLPFDRKTMWRMRRKLRVFNNSDLCYHAGDDFRGVDDLYSTILQGITPCGASKPPMETIKHR